MWRESERGEERGSEGTDAPTCNIGGDYVEEMLWGRGREAHQHGFRSACDERHHGRAS